MLPDVMGTARLCRDACANKNVKTLIDYLQGGETIGANEQLPGLGAPSLHPPVFARADVELVALAMLTGKLVTLFR